MKSILKKWCILFTLAIVGCAVTSNSQRLDSNAPPIKDVSIIFGLGELSAKSIASTAERSFYQTKFSESLMTRFPEIFRANEVPLQRITVQNKLIDKQDVPPLLEKTKTSHLLVVSPFSTKYLANSYGSRSSNITIVYHAALWDASLKKLVWSAFPEVLLLEGKPLLTSQELAAAILKGLHKDSFIKLKQGFPIDLEGKEIMHVFGYGNDK